MYQVKMSSKSKFHIISSFALILNESKNELVEAYPAFYWAYMSTNALDVVTNRAINCIHQVTSDTTVTQHVACPTHVGA